MAMKPCKECGTEVSDKAKTCPKCGVDRPTQKNALTGGQIGCLIVLAPMAIMVGVCFGTADFEVEPHSESMAAIMCENFVEDRLTAPASAEFQSYPSQNVQHLGGGHYRVQAHVDSQNGFGAMLRNDYVCEVRYQPASDQWRLESLSLS